ncbi:MAG TPA: hypothetical protein VFT72_16370 [Opitutaceae bacterium]|nr:hypothetical protein [Opitutaceae bacterium]
MMLRTLAVFSLALLVNGLRAEEKAAPSDALSSAMQKLAAGDDDWAYTQVFRRTDCSTGDTVARFDPSKPAGSQWQLLKLRGRTPTEAEAAKWCRRREQDVNQTDSRALVELLDLEHARILSQDTEHASFEIPLKKNTIAHIPAENFVAYADVDCEQAALEKLSIVLRQTVRLIGGIAQIQTAKGEMVFKSVGEDGTRPAYIVASGSGQALFRKLNRSAEIIFTDQRRVKS